MPMAAGQACGWKKVNRKVSDESEMNSVWDRKIGHPAGAIEQGTAQFYAPIDDPRTAGVGIIEPKRA